MVSIFSFMDRPEIAAIRVSYSKKELTEKAAAPSPFQQFGIWWQEAVAAQIDEVNAMTLATASADGIPSARIVLLKDYNQEGFIFFSNYESFKGKQLTENPRACLVFFWKELERQVRITGLVESISPADSDTYFQSRPLDSRIGAVTSPQSHVIESREWLQEKFTENKTRLGENVVRPDYWGGYIVRPVIMEFWQGRPNRLHDRLQYNMVENNWKIERLAP